MAFEKGSTTRIVAIATTLGLVAGYAISGNYLYHAVIGLDATAFPGGVWIQRTFAADPAGAVLDGRDIGAVICPDAEVKLFVTASLEARTSRRLKELLARGETISFEQLKRQIDERDQRDMNRADSPLRPAPDAHLLDTTDLSIEAAVEAACRIIDAALARPGT